MKKMVPRLAHWEPSQLPDIWVEKRELWKEVPVCLPFSFPFSLSSIPAVTTAKRRIPLFEHKFTYHKYIKLET